MTRADEGITVSTIAGRVGGTLDGADVTVRTVAPLDDAGPDAITFLTDATWAKRWGGARAGAALVPRELDVPDHDPASRALVRVADPEIALVTVLELFAPAPVRPDAGVHATAVVHPDAHVDPSARIGPHVSIDRGASIGANVDLHAGVRIYSDVEIGADSVLHANCVVRERCRIGRRVLMHPGVLIGADGFGYRPDPAGGGLLKMPHIGSVEIQDDVEIGAGTCVDRGKFGATVVGEGTKLDNLVQIGHNAVIGRSCVIAAQSGIAGSARIGNGVRMGGQAGVAEHITVGDGASLGAQAGAMRSVPAGELWMGNPARPARERLRQHALLTKLPGLIQQISGQPKGGADATTRAPDPD